jgi:hypothetical protein
MPDRAEANKRWMCSVSGRWRLLLMCRCACLIDAAPCALRGEHVHGGFFIFHKPPSIQMNFDSTPMSSLNVIA